MDWADLPTTTPPQATRLAACMQACARAPDLSSPVTGCTAPTCAAVAATDPPAESPPAKAAISTHPPAASAKGTAVLSAGPGTPDTTTALSVTTAATCLPRRLSRCLRRLQRRLATPSAGPPSVGSPSVGSAPTAAIDATLLAELPPTTHLSPRVARTAPAARELHAQPGASQHHGSEWDDWKSGETELAAATAARRYADGTGLGRVFATPCLQPRHARAIAEGRKTVEGRPATPSGWATKACVGDAIRFRVSRSDGNRLVVRVLCVRRFATFRDMLEACGIEHCLPGVPSVADGERVARGMGSSI